MCESCTCKYIGKKIYGFCNGFFGRSSYSDKIIEAIGHDWVVARDPENHEVYFADFKDSNQRDSYLKDWMNDENDNISEFVCECGGEYKFQEIDGKGHELFKCNKCNKVNIPESM
jgi:hypothetical protein